MEGLLAIELVRSDGAIVDDIDIVREDAPSDIADFESYLGGTIVVPDPKLSVEGRPSVVLRFSGAVADSRLRFGITLPLIV